MIHFHKAIFVQYNNTICKLYLKIDDDDPNIDDLVAAPTGTQRHRPPAAQQLYVTSRYVVNVKSFPILLDFLADQGYLNNDYDMKIGIDGGQVG